MLLGIINFVLCTLRGGVGDRGTEGGEEGEVQNDELQQQSGLKDFRLIGLLRISYIISFYFQNFVVKDEVMVKDGFEEWGIGVE